jgi:nucleoside-diphosphate-sugar epimerase
VKVLVTGVSGNLGAEIGRRLIEEGHQVIGVVNKSRQLITNGRQSFETEEFSANPGNGSAIWTLQWDMRKPLTLPPDELRFILENVDTVVHSAAVTDFGLHRDVYQQSNVGGTQNLIHLIQQFARPIHLVHVSTAYVSGTVRGAYKESDLDRSQGFSNFYEESKYMAEQLLRAHPSRNVAVSVVRPSIIVGEGHDGRIRDFKHLYPLLKIVGSGQITSVAGYYDSSINVVPIDYVVEGIVALASKKPVDGGRTYHVVSEKNMTMRELSDVLAEFPAVHVPRVLPPSTFYGGTRNQGEAKLYDRVVKRFECYFSKWARFDKEAMRGLLPSTSIPPNADLIRNLVRFGQADGYL